ncbi:ATP-binding cassette domain-containing protein [Flexivirga caeni]|uniref:ATP-binding cassette domain-containing protein n=1 Tax=Flexivirga caeni TaxID=2294115 RepID=A0A3M9M0C2_9MICO|nr:ATP-binding cassette domain-containing protein [Flexivirga caeni]RNI19009.1 ATP-binding cassette domain-containing protein [Flexivirga caeni]
MTERRRSGPVAVLGALLALYLAVPLVAFVIRLATSSQTGFGESGLFDAARTSAVGATISAAVVGVLGVPLAHWLAHSRGPLHRVVGVLVQLPLALPPVMSGIVLIYLVGPYTWLGERFNGRLTESLAGVVIAQTFVASPFLVIAARSAFESVDPQLEDVAATLGHRPLSRFVRVDLRVAARAIRAGLLMTWLRAIGEYGATVLLAYHPYTLPVFTSVQFAQTGIPTTQAPTAVALAVAAIVLLLASFRLPGAVRARLRRPAPSVPPVRPEGPVAEPVSFDVDTHVGGFHLQVAHQAASPRIAVLGASGAGKSMLLRSLAGLLGPDVGIVRLGPDRIDGVRVEDRRLGYVPQQHGLFPDRTTWDQATFGIHADQAVAAWWLQRLRLDGLQDRLPEQLSGGQRQRVVLASALAGTPRLLLLDEPFSALDYPVRQELIALVRSLQQQDSLATVLVTHDPAEAAMLADELLVIAGGRLEQAGTVREVFDAPASPAVARLLGLRNVSAGVMVAGGAVVTDGVRVCAAADELPGGTPVTWCVRPEFVRIAADGEHEVAVADVADLGSRLVVRLRWSQGLELEAHQVISAHHDGAPVVGEVVRAHLDPAGISVWPVPAVAPAPPSL